MTRKVATVGFCLSMWAGLTASAMAWGKPADLPGNNQIECCGGEADPPEQRKFSIELDFTPQGITLKVESGGEPAPPPAIDPLLPAFIDQWLVHVADLLARPERFMNLNSLLAKLPHVGAQENSPPPAPAEPQRRVHPTDKAEHLHQMFEIAEVYRRTGYLESARFYYQRIHLLAPTSRLGRLAIDRLQQVEERLRDAAEEAETPGRTDEPGPESMNREIHKGLIPLGLVCVRY